MRKQLIAMVILPLMVYNCHENTNIDSSSENVLLAKEVTVTSTSIIDNDKNPEWTASFIKNTFFDTIFSIVLKNQFPVYGGAMADFEDIELQRIYSVDEIPQRIKMKMDNGIEKSINEMLFYEKWNFDRESLKLTKEVLGWCPIKNWNENGEYKRQKSFYIYPKIQTKGIKIAESIFYEIPWYFEYPTTNVGFDKLGFLSFIIDGIKAGKIIAYDPIYIVDKSKRKFSIDELSKYINQDLNPRMISNNMISMLFEEDWYFDKKTFAIIKDVKSIAFVQDKYEPEKGVSSKKILFFIIPN